MKTKLLFLITLLAMTGGSLFAQGTQNVKGAYGCGSPASANVIGDVGSRYIDQCANPPAEWIITSINPNGLGNGVPTAIWTQGGGSGGNPSPANLVDPTSSTYGATQVVFVVADGTTSTSNNQLSSATQNCSPSHAGLVAHVVDQAAQAYSSAFANWGYGTTAGAIAFVSSASPCTGNAWNIVNGSGAALNANFSISGTAVIALYKDSGAAFQAAQTATFSAANTPGKSLAVPCGVYGITTGGPFVPTTTTWAPLVQFADVNGCPGARTVLIVHSAASTSAPISGGTTGIIIGSPTAVGAPSGAWNPTGGYTTARMSRMEFSSLGGLLPGISGKSMVMIQGYNQMDDLAAFSLAASSNITSLWTVVADPSGEQRIDKFDFQDPFPNSGATNVSNWIAVSAGGQGPQVISNGIMAFQFYSPPISPCTTNVFMTGMYITQTNNGIIIPSSCPNTIITMVGNLISAFGNSFDDGNNTGIQVNSYGNWLTTLSQATFIWRLQNSGTVVDLSGTQHTPASGGSGGSMATGSGTILNRGGNRLTLSGAATGITTGVTMAYFGNGAKGACTGTATASSTLGLYPLGGSTTTCTSTTPNAAPIVVSGAGRQLENLTVTATAAGVNASSGVVTVLKNGSATTVTCTLGTSTACVDNTHQVSVADGDLISIQFTTQAADTLAGVKAGVSIDP